MVSETIRRIALGCGGVAILGLLLVGLSNWIGQGFGSGKAVKELREIVDSVDAAQMQNAGRNLARIEEIENEVKKLKDAEEDQTDKYSNLESRLTRWKKKLKSFSRPTSATLLCWNLTCIDHK
jgi:hypothetical protein